MVLYAAYGSNLHPLRLADRIPSCRLAGSAFVPGWSLHFHKRSTDGSGKCNILNSGAGIYVAVFEMSATEKERLDEIEGVGAGYELSTIEVPHFGRCFTYRGASSHIQDGLAPYDWYKEMVLLGCQKLKIPGHYTSLIEAIETARDPHEKRNQQQWQIVERLRRNT